MKKLSRMICVAVAVVVLGQLFGTASAAILPTGGGASQTWDLVVSGSLAGVTYLTFYDDNSVSGFMSVTSRKTAVSSGETAAIGTAFVMGEWSINEKGNIVGYLANDPADKVRMDITRFEGKVAKSGRKLKLKGETAFGYLTFTGLPAVELGSLVEAPFSSRWLLTLRQSTVVDHEITNPQTFIEVLTAVPLNDLFLDEADKIFPNHYVATGQTADRCVEAWSILSQRGHMAMTVYDTELPESGDCAEATWTKYDLRAAAGKLNAKKSLAVLRGTLAEVANIRVGMTLYMGN